MGLSINTIHIENDNESERYLQNFHHQPLFTEAFLVNTGFKNR